MVYVKVLDAAGKLVRVDAISPLRFGGKVTPYTPAAHEAQITAEEYQTLVAQIRSGATT